MLAALQHSGGMILLVKVARRLWIVFAPTLNATGPRACVQDLMLPIGPPEDVNRPLCCGNDLHRH